MEKLEKDMTPKLIGETWRKYPTETSMQKATYGLFECQYCKKEFETDIQSVRRGHTKSCGCNTREAQSTHGMGQNKFYKTWHTMIRRCTNPNFIKYKDYGGRGITVCEDWMDVINFVTWCEQTYIEGMTLDRIDNDKGYSPDNCRWTTREIQNTNQRVKSTNTSGFAGVSFGPLKNRWVANIGVNGKRIRIGSFKDKMDAVQARDNYIIENGLPHKLSGLTKNEKENK